jgi:hypothetical protein
VFSVSDKTITALRECDLWMPHCEASSLPVACPHPASQRQNLKVKVKCTLVQALRLCTGRTAHRGSRGTAILFHDHGTRRG